jgi:hypothetical protein
MRFNLVNRRLHYWVAFAAALPLLVISASGLLLQLKKQWSWVQPVRAASRCSCSGPAGCGCSASPGSVGNVAVAGQIHSRI